MSKKLKMPDKGLFGLPSSVRQTNNEEDPDSNQSTQVPENHDVEEFGYQRTEETNNSNTPILENSNTPTPENSSTSVLTETSNNLLSNQELLEYLDTIEVSDSSSTEVLENLSVVVPNILSTEHLKPQNTPVVEVLSTEDSRYQGIGTLPKPQKNNRTKDDKKPARKQASVHLTGASLKALHLYAYEEGLEKSEVVEKALRKFIPKKYFE